MCIRDRFLSEWRVLFESKSGERGIFNRGASNRKVLDSGRREENDGFGMNPCAEIILRPYEFCYM